MSESADVTANPSALWTTQQLVDTSPFDSAPRFLQRDRDGTYGDEFQRRIKTLGIEEVISAPLSPWQNSYAEWLIGSIRHELLNHVIVLDKVHLKRLLSEYFVYYHDSRTRVSLSRNTPMPREVEPRDGGHVIAIPLVGGYITVTVVAPLDAFVAAGATTRRL
jgi:putative transposase